nr:hypothetical protein [Tanacetum cinerariifolium]
EVVAGYLPLAEVHNLVPAAVVRGRVTVVSELLLVFWTLALVFGGVAPVASIVLLIRVRVPDVCICKFNGKHGTELLRVLMSRYQLDRHEHLIISDIVPVHLISPWY